MILLHATPWPRLWAAVQARAAHWAQRTGGVVPADELESVGLVGLAEAWAHYDPTVGVRFWTYAEHRIDGSMRDALRQANGRYATSYKVRRRHEVSLEDPLRQDEEHTIGDSLAAPDCTPEAALLADERARRCLAGLTGDEALLVVWYAVEGYNMAEIGAALGCTAARISQRLTALQQRMQEVACG